MVHEEVFFYKIWLWYKQKIKKRMLKVRLPQKGDNFYIDGYPRSGNTYCLTFTKYVLPHAKYAHHLHSLAPLKLALSEKIPTIVLMRHPKECIASLAILKSYYNRGFSKNENNIKDLIYNYVSYYTYVLNNFERINLLPFHTVINSTELLSFFRNKLGISIDLSEMQILEIENNYAERQGNKPSERQNLPSEEKKSLKRRFYEQLESQPDFKNALKLYEQLLSKLNN